MFRILWFQYFQMIALVLAIIFYKGLKHYRIQLFVLILIIVNAVEIIGVNYRSYKWFNNYIIYNLYLILTTPLYLYLYATMLELRDKALMVYTVICIFCMAFIVLNFFLLQGTQPFNTYSMMLISLLYIVFSCLVLFKISIGSQAAVNLYKQPYFWISSANLFFSITTLVLLGFQHYILVNQLTISNKTLYRAIVPVANFVLYSGFSYAFILCGRKTRS